MIFSVDERVETAKQLLEILLEDEIFVPGALSDVTETGTCGYVFRGQGDARWPLLPSAHRAGNPLYHFTSTSPGDEPFPGDSSVLHLARTVHCEIRAVVLFLEQADHSGIATPLDYAGLDVHQPLLDALFREEADFDCCAHPFPSKATRPSYAFAQHHGVPTRLLDWSESALKAAYFAAADVCRPLGGVVESQDMSIVALDTRWFTKHGVALVRAPRHINSNLRAQEGVFTLVTNGNAFLLANGSWPSIENVAEQAEKGTLGNMRRSLIRLSLPASEAVALLRSLYKYRITRHHLQPTLANSASAFAYKQALWPNWT